MDEKKLNPLNLFIELTTSGLSPNQYYVMLCIHKSILSCKVNVAVEMKYLANNDWIEGSPAKLTQKSIDLIDYIENLFNAEVKENVKKKASLDMEMIEKYVELGPKGKLGHGRPWRSSATNLKKVFTWFFRNHKYTWETILQATAVYLQDMEKDNHKFTQQSHYFVRKSDYSKLADYCENVLHDNFHDLKESHDEKIV
jgi:hypothetical protein